MSLTEAGESLDIKKWIIALFSIITLTIIAYYPSLENGFTNWDDPNYVLENPYISKLNNKNVKTIFSEYYMGNYHPLTMLSLALDYKSGKPDAYVYHRTNLVLHSLNSVVVFILIFLLIRNFPVALITGILFGVHAIHVESVAWISERKDVLYTFFFLLSLVCYTRYTNNKKYTLYFLSLILFLLSCLSKGMAVSLSVTLIAIDYLKGRNLLSKNVILEKIPFFIVSVIFGVVAVFAQKLGPDTEGIPDYNFFKRILFASYGFCQYIFKTIYPFQLSAFYPYPEKQAIPTQFFIYPIIAMGILFLIWKFSSKSKLYVFGMAFFIINVFLVLQLLPVGRAIMADRYAYVPSIGIFLMISALLYRAFQNQNIIFYVATISFYVVAQIWFTNGYVKVWDNSISLWNHVLANFESDVAYNNRGVAYSDKGEYLKAIEDFNKAVTINPNHKEAYNNRGVAYANIEKYEDAIKDYNQSLSISPAYSNAYYNRGNAYAKLKKYELAIEDYNKVVRLNPAYAGVYNNRGLSLKEAGRYKEALDDLNKAVKLNPKNAEAYSNRSLVKYQLQDFQGAIDDNKIAISLKPGTSSAYLNSGIAKCRAGNLTDALLDFDAALRYNPSDKEVYLNRGITYYHLRELEKAMADIEKAISIDPLYAEAFFNRGIIKSGLNDNKGALEDYTTAIKFDPKHARAYANRGILKFADKDYKAVIDNLSEAISIDPAYADAYCNRGLARTYIKDNKGAMDDYNKAIEINPSFGLAYNNRGVLKYQSGDKKGGCEDWKMAVNAGYESSRKFLETYCLQ
ncbi:MAG: tetratricopeptide repeat protein [Cytophagaceae bacterium]